MTCPFRHSLGCPVSWVPGPCPVSRVPCPVSCVLFLVSLVPGLLSLVPCPVSRVPCSCPVSRVLCPASRVLRPLSCVLCPVSRVKCPLPFVCASAPPAPFFCAQALAAAWHALACLRPLPSLWPRFLFMAAVMDSPLSSAACFPLGQVIWVPQWSLFWSRAS